MRISDWSSDVCSSDLGHASMSTRAQLSRLLRAARLRRVLIVLAGALPLLGVAGAAGWRWLGGDAPVLLVSSLLGTSVLIAIAYASRLDLSWLARRLDGTQPAMGIGRAHV